jgi:6-phosphofructokinase 1
VSVLESAGEDGMKRVGVLTGGGDAPGLNAAIKALVYKLDDLGIQAVALQDGWRGLLDEQVERAVPLARAAVRTWDREGGTKIGSSRVNPFSTTVEGRKVDRSAEVVRNVERLELDALVAMGGEDTLGVAHRLSGAGLPVVGVPKTVDFDLNATDYTIGFYTAATNCANAIERARTPAGSHHWVQLVEVMGRHAGHLALWSGVAGSAYLILIPEVPFSYARLIERLRERLAGPHSPGYAVVVVAEGARSEEEGLVTVDDRRDDFGHVSLGGISQVIARRITGGTPYDARAAILGHPQRGGPPVPVDRIMATLFGAAAAVAVHDRAFGTMVSARGIAPSGTLVRVPLGDAVGRLKLVDVERQYDPHLYHLRR